MLINKKTMKFRKGYKIIFKNNRIETITKSSNDRINGMIETDANIYSVDFLMRWLDFGFIKIEK
jgi:hypothetical protein